MDPFLKYNGSGQTRADVGDATISSKVENTPSRNVACGKTGSMSCGKGWEVSLETEKRTKKARVKVKSKKGFG